MEGGVFAGGAGGRRKVKERKEEKQGQKMVKNQGSEGALKSISDE